MAQFYADENVPLQVVSALRDLGHDVLTAIEAANANARIPDREVLAFAASTSRVLITLNRRDFLKLHRAGSHAHAGIVICRQDGNFVALASRIDSAVAAEPQMTGHLIRINRIR